MTVTVVHKLGWRSGLQGRVLGIVRDKELVLNVSSRMFTNGLIRRFPETEL